jgi:DNA adenine methylase
MNDDFVTPFLKWAGGKRWLWRRHGDVFPRDFNRYIEPFLGGGAIFLNLQPKEALLSDSNGDLVNTYVQVRDCWRAVYNRLVRHQRSHCQSHYYDVRASVPHDPIDRAARFLYLNRTCWNGLYRVNRKGVFNVPMGTKSAVLLESDSFPLISKILCRAKVEAMDFAESLSRAKRRDLVFVDPPYTVNHNHNGFLKYNEKIFSWNDQIGLADSVEAAARRGAKIIVSQADHQSIRDLYCGIGKIRVIDRASVLAADASRRRKTTELLIFVNV